ncbi:MAG TPA: PAS domain-containing protein, partial [Alphaproteobacteria bacterium]
MSGGIDHKALFQSMHFPRFLVKAGEAGGYVLVDANEKALSYAGHARDKVTGKALDLFINKEIFPGFRDSLDLAMKEMKAGAFSPSSDLPGGAITDAFMISPFMSPDGKVALLDVMVLPAGSGASSLQRERDDAISLLTSVFDVSEVGIIVTDRHHRIVRINDSFVRIYGWKR